MATFDAPSTPAPGGELLTYEEAADVLGITLSAVKSAVKNGKLQPVKLRGITRKYLRRGDVLSYPERRNLPVERRYMPTPATVDMPSPEKLRDMAVALSGPTIEALRDAQATARDAQATARHAIDGLVNIAFGLALGATGATGAASILGAMGASGGPSSTGEPGESGASPTGAPLPK